MDDTQQSRASDAATRKRRSSILKSQRPARAPLSELEFSVATPTDTAKSRRVSFSKRTGVAEFVTNEATTTWKNFYEEHNKSLESSGNESAANPPRRSVGHLGKRIFEDQFQDEAIDLCWSPTKDPRSVETSINNVKFNQFALECTTDDKKLSALRQNFEFSTFTVSEQPSKLFSDDLAISGLAEVSEKIDVNFSTVQSIGDDLNEIQKDLERHQANPQNFVYPPSQNGRNMSGYIEVDLNMTHGAIECGAESLSDDMSITDTIHSPKVNVSKNGISGQNDKSLNKDWVADKENIAVNPYAMPKESENFAINEIPGKILVFDGKRVTLQSEKEPITDYRKTLISTEQPVKPAQRKTIVLNVHDDLPNFVSNPHTSILTEHSKCTVNETLVKSNCDISTSMLAEIKNNSQKMHTMVFGDTSGDISMTQVLPTNIASEKHEKRRTIVFDDDTADISVTQAVPANVIIAERNVSLNELPTQKRKTMVFEDESCNISITQALPTNVILGKSGKKTIIYETDSGNTSGTQILPTIIPVIESEKQKILVFNDESGNITLSKVIPSDGISGTLKEADAKFSTSLVIPPTRSGAEKRKTIVFNDEDGDISITKAIPSNILFSEQGKQLEKTVLDETGLLSTLHSEPEKRKTIVFNDEEGNISITKAIPLNILFSTKGKTAIEETHAIISTLSSISEPEKRKTIVFNDEKGNISLTKAIPSNILFLKQVEQERKTALDTTDIIPLTPPSELKPEKSKSIIFKDEDGNISLSEAIPSELILLDKFQCETKPKKIQVLNSEDKSDVSTTKSLASSILIERENFGLLHEMQYSGNQSQHLSSRPIIAITYEDDIDISMTQALPTNIITSEKRKTIVYDEESGNVSVTQAVSANLVLPKTSPAAWNTKSANLSNTETMPENLFFSKNAIEQETAIGETCRETELTSGMLKNIAGLTNVAELERQKSVSFMRAVSPSFVLPEKSRSIEKKKSVVHANNTGDIPVTGPAPLNITHTEVAGLLKQVKSNTLSPTDIMREIVAKLDSNNSVTANENIEKTKNKDTSVCMKNFENTLNEIPLKQQSDGLDKENITKRETDQNRLNLNSESFVHFQNDTLDKSNQNKSMYKEVMNLQNIMVHQTTDTFMRNDKLEQESVLSTISSSDGKKEFEFNRYTESSVINAEFVKVSHKAPIPSSKIELITANLEREQKQSAITLSDVIVPLCSGSTLTQDSSACLQKNVPFDSKILQNTSQDQPSSDIDYALVQSDSNVSRIKPVEKTILTDLFDMASDSGSKIVDNCVPSFTPDTNAQNITESKTNSVVNSVSDYNLFYITKDCDCETQTGNLDEGKYVSKDLDSLKTTGFNPQVKTWSSGEIQENMENEPDQLPLQKNDSTNLDRDRNFEKVIASCKNYINDVSQKSCINADSTKELLEMLSEFTKKEEEENPIKPMAGRCKVDSENKIPTVPVRVMSLPQRQSLVFSREDLINNISMAQAVLQSSVATEEGDSEPELDTSIDTPSPNKHSCLSSEVVKTLHFEDDESSSDFKDNITTDLKAPLNKTVIAERSTIADEHRKSLLIPAHMKNVSNGNEDLMNELVNSEVNRDFKEIETSTCGNQIQVNLFTSSQIDLEPKSTPCTTQKDIKNSYAKNTTESLPELNISSHKTRKSSDLSKKTMDQTVPGVILFDAENPLNNVLLASTDSAETKRNNPYKLSENISASQAKHDFNVSFKDSQCNDGINVQYDVQRVTPDLLEPSFNNYSLKNASENQSTLAQFSKPLTIDQSVEITSSTINNAIINTDLTMQNKKQLLEQSLSVTLADSTLGLGPYEGQLYSKNASRDSSENISLRSSETHIEVVYRQQQSRDSSKLDTTVHIVGDTQNNKIKKKQDKRKHNTSTSTLSAQEVTPKPASKIPKRSLSPIASNTDDSCRSKYRSNNDMKITDEKHSRSLKMSSPVKSVVISPKIISSLNQKPSTKQVTVEYDTEKYASNQAVDAGFDTFKDKKHDSNSHASSPRGSKNMGEANSLSEDIGMNQECASPMEGQGGEGAGEPDDVIAAIWSLPCIRSGECVWERSAGAECELSAGTEWAFLLPRAGLRLLVRLAPGPVRAATPVTAISVQPVEPVCITDEKHAESAVCARLALEAAQHVCGAVRAAGGVGGALRAGAAAARAARHWRRAMHLSWLHLGYSLRPDGRLTLTVANIPLRSVWEVTMTIALETSDHQIPWPGSPVPIPWPRARDVRVRALQARVQGDVTRAPPAPAGWGHAPRTLWSVFRYLKNLQPEDSLFGGLVPASKQ